MTALFIALPCLYLSAVLFISYRAFRVNQGTVEDYFLLSRNTGAWLLVGTVTASMVNSLAVTGTPSLFYTGGILYSQMFFAVTGVCLLMYLLGPKICTAGRRYSAITQGELFGRHYQSNTLKWLTGGVGILSIFPFLAIQLAAVGKILSAGVSSSLSFEAAVILFSAFIGLYVFAGGSRAAVWTDSIQGLIAFLLFAVLAILALHWTGGLKSNIGTIYQVMPEKLSFSADNLKIFADNVLSWSLAFFLWPHIFARMFMAKDAAVVRKTALYSLIILNSLVLIILLITVSATAELYGSLDDPDQLLATMMNIHLPSGDIMVLILILALTMSTVDSMLLALSSIASCDFFANPARASHGSLSRAKTLTLGILILGTLFAVNTLGHSALVPWVTLSASVVSLLFWPLIGMCFIRQRQPLPSVAAIVIGLLVIWGFNFLELGKSLPFGYATASFLLSACTFIFLSALFWRSTEPSEC